MLREKIPARRDGRALMHPSRRWGAGRCAGLRDSGADPERRGAALAGQSLLRGYENVDVLLDIRRTPRLVALANATARPAPCATCAAAWATGRNRAESTAQ
jgi:hypothetical protein